MIFVISGNFFICISWCVPNVFILQVRIDISWTELNISGSFDLDGDSVIVVAIYFQNFIFFHTNLGWTFASY